MQNTLTLKAHPTYSEDDGPAAALLPITPELTRSFLEEISEFNKHKERKPNLAFHDYHDYTLTALELFGPDNSATKKLDEITGDNSYRFELFNKNPFTEEQLDTLNMPKEGVRRVINEYGVHWEGFVKHTSIRWETESLAPEDLEELLAAFTPTPT